MNGDEHSAEPQALQSSIPQLASKLPNLAQSVRRKSLKTARSILIAVGLITIVANLVYYMTLESRVDAEINAKLQQARSEARANGEEFIVDEEVLADFRNGAIFLTSLVQIGFMAIGMAYLVMAVYLQRWPVPITITALVLYVCGQAITMYLDPSVLLAGWIFRAAFIVALIRAIQTAIAFESQRRLEITEDATVAPQVELA